MKDILINGKYRIERKIGGGGCGDVYSGTDIVPREDIAIKLEYARHDLPILEHESTVYKSLAGGIGIPRMRWYGVECDFYVMISDLLGPSLEDLFNFCDRKFSLKTVLQLELADQLIPRVKYLHAKSFVHGDIKPENFLMGTGRLGNVVHLIDFGLAKEYQDPETHIHTVYYDKHNLGGTVRYASVNNHLGIGLKAATEDARNELIKEKKINTLTEDLCRGLPEAFTSCFTHVQTLKFEDRPNYSYLRNLFHNLFIREGLQYDHVFDWTIKKYLMMHDSFDQSVQTRISKRGNKGRHDLREAPFVGRSRSSLGQLIGQRVSKSTKAGRLRHTDARKAR